MAQIDVIVSWPRNCDFPIWRAFIARERARFNRVFVVWTEHAGGDYSPFVEANFPDVEFLDSPNTGEWRDCAVNYALDRSTAEWVWFTEQDLLIVDAERFWPRFDRDAYGFREENDRWHPASLFVKRELVNRTRRYFGPEPVDHFYTFGKDLDALTKPGHLRGFVHLQGTAQNHYLLEAGETAGFFRRDRWRDYLRGCLESGVPIEPTWERWARQECASS